MNGPPPAGSGATGLWQLPHPPERFLGADREALRDALVGLLLAEPAGHAVVHGGAGIGKSTIARAVACDPRAEDFFKRRRAFVLLDAAPSAAAMLDALRAALGLAGSADPAGAIAETLAEAPALLVLDNLETPWRPETAATEDVLRGLAAVKGVRLLATIRGGELPLAPAWAREDEPDRLAPPADRDLFLAIAGAAKATDPQLGPLLAELDGLPLAIELLAARARPFASLAQRWQRRPERLAMLARGQGKGRLECLDASLALSVDALGDAGRRLYAMLGRLPDGLRVDDAPALLAGDGPAAAEELLRLRLAHGEAAWLRMLAPVRARADAQGLSGEDLARLTGHFPGLAGALPYRWTAAADEARALRARDEIVNIEAVLDGSLAGANPGTPDERGRAWLWVRLGDARMVLGALTLALAAYERAQRLFERLATEAPDDLDRQHDLSVSHDRIGNVRVAEGDLAGALRAYEAGLAIRERLAAADPRNTEWQRDLSVSHDRIGDVRRAEGDLAGALRAYQASHAIAERLAPADPGNAEWQRDLSVSHNKIGEVRAAQGDLAGALGSYAAGLAIAERLAAADPRNSEWRRDLIVSHWKIAAVGEQKPDPALAIEHFRKALALARAMAERGTLAPVDAWVPAELERRLAALGTPPAD